MRRDRAALAIAVAAVLTGCAPAPAPAPAAPPPPDPVTVCTNQLTYWAGEQLRGAPDGGLDYQEMGLTGAQSAALATLVDQTRAQGPGRSPGWVADRARALCTELATRPPSTARGWP